MKPTKPNGLEHSQVPDPVSCSTHPDLQEDDMAPRTRAEQEEDLAKVLDTTNQLLMWMKTREIANNTNGNGKKSLYLPIIAAVLISVTPQLFNSVWWTRGTERDVQNAVLQAQHDLQTEVKFREALELRIGTMETWQQKALVNFAERGWRIDPITADITKARK